MLNNNGQQLTENTISTCEYFIIAIITVITVGNVMIIDGIVNGFRVNNVGMSLAGSCSAVISATCHSMQQNKNMSVLPVKWEAEKTVGPIGYCSFSSFEIDMFIAGERYENTVETE